MFFFRTHFNNLVGTVEIGASARGQTGTDITMYMYILFSKLSCTVSEMRILMDSCDRLPTLYLTSTDKDTTLIQAGDFIMAIFV